MTLTILAFTTFTLMANAPDPSCLTRIIALHVHGKEVRREVTAFKIVNGVPVPQGECK